VGRRVIIGLAVVVALAAVGWGAWAWHRSTIEVSTDDAYVEGMISPVSAKVSGHVVELLVNDNTAVRAGDVLLRVDPRDFEAKRDQARAAVGVAEASVRAARAELPVTRDMTRSQVDETRAVRESGHAAKHAVEHLAHRLTVLAGDRHQRTGIALVAHAQPPSKQKSPPVLGGFIGLDVSLSRRDSASTSCGDCCCCGANLCHCRNL